MIEVARIKERKELDEVGEVLFIGGYGRSLNFNWNRKLVVGMFIVRKKRLVNLRKGID